MKYKPKQTFTIVALILITAIFVPLYLAELVPLYIGWLVACTVTALLLFRYDKMQAGGKGMRVPEQVLHGVTLLGGFPGSFLGMMIPPRHKTQHSIFWIILAVAAAIHAVLLFFIIEF